MSERKSPRQDERLSRDPEDRSATVGDPLSVPVPEDVGGGEAPDRDDARTGPGRHTRADRVHPEPDEPAD
ncbi:hypothetical protein ABTX77_36840 [Streptomyces sp. NPDC097704]|uniref:hypothetical protein n=1 Tax=Streptomyces sp. NPDC097704 TaxID=3157101 RepID=UPI00333432F3